MKTIILYSDAAGPRQWLLTARERLVAAGHAVTFAGASAARGEASSGSLLRACEWIDGAINSDRGGALSARLAGEAAAPFAGGGGPAAGAGASVEVHYHDGARPTRQWLQILYDGVPGDEALFSALLDGRVPQIEIVDIEDGATLAAGVASLESARSLMGAADAVYARVLTLLETALRFDGAPTLGEAQVHRSPGIGPSHALRQIRSGLIGKPIRAAYEAMCYFPHWRVGWRFTTGGSVWDAASLDDPPWRVLPDPGDHFYADPFPIAWGGRRMIFFEDFDHRSGKGTIAAVEVREEGSTGPVLQVLEEPWHLSYPFMIEDSGALWMIPESSAARTVDLYRADRFPDRWVKEATLLSGIEASDATVIRHGGAFWMFASVRDGAGSHSDTLSIFKAPALAGPWMAHAHNPVLVDARSARPAGNMVLREGALWRPAQVCDHAYGAAVALCEVTRLDDDGFAQSVRHVLRPGAMWPGRRLHTLNEAFGIACIDGWAASPRNPLLARWLEPWCLRRGNVGE